MDGAKLEAFGGNIVIMDTAKSEETRGIAINPMAKGVGEQEKLIIGQVISTSDQLMEDGKWWTPPIKVGEYVIYNIHAGTANVWQHQANEEGKLVAGVFIYRIIKWTEVLAKYKG